MKSAVLAACGLVVDPGHALDNCEVGERVLNDGQVLLRYHVAELDLTRSTALTELDPMSRPTNGLDFLNSAIS